MHWHKDNTDSHMASPQPIDLVASKLGIDDNQSNIE